jgi:hypothetical protein
MLHFVPDGDTASFSPVTSLTASHIRKLTFLSSDVPVVKTFLRRNVIHITWDPCYHSMLHPQVVD